ncbi:MAG: DUF3137 domain-containing protein, partial [Planctomycetes bacterium]|nr:DUF3137 domain-containing protein [Planctomycetota bacterium]
DTGDSVFFAHTLLPLLVGSNRSKSIFDGYRGSLGEVPFYLGRLKVWQVLEEGETSVKFMDTVAVFELPCAFHNHLHIEPKSNTIATIDAATQESIRFESHEFTQAFKVHCKDKRFAYDIVNPSFMESLLQSPSVEVYLCTGLLLVNATDSNELSVESCKQLFSVGQGVLRSLPRHILRDAKALWREHHSVRS